jgi:UDP-glucose 6-dehydrogenase
LIEQVYTGWIHECSALESELAKYVANLYWATRVTFVNEIAQVCEAFSADYEQVRHAWLSDPRVNDDYTRIEGFPRGFDGRCWPKDLSGLIVASQNAGYDPGFLRAVQESNERFRT